MGGLNVCQAIPPVVSHDEFGTSWAEALAGGAGKVCAIAKNLSDGRYGRKQCNGYKTPPLTWFLLRLRVDDVEGFALDLDFWVGIEENEQGKSCLWAGVDGGPETQLCTRTPDCYSTEVPYEAITSLVEDLLDQLHEAVEKDSVIDLILKAVAAIVALVIIAGVAIILSKAFAIAIAGASLLGLGGALVG